jgi:hypothetical protein
VKPPPSRFDPPFPEDFPALFGASDSSEHEAIGAHTPIMTAVNAIFFMENAFLARSGVTARFPSLR